VTTTSEDLYWTGVNQAMSILSDKYRIPAVTPSEFEQYMTNNPYPADNGSKIKMINEQLWILHLTNPIEAYCNWRRSGFPILKPSNYYGVKTIDSQTIPRRLCYPLFEKTYNPDGYEQAIERMGGNDDWNQGVWWDVKY
jgi:hypothetical protein